VLPSAFSGLVAERRYRPNTSVDSSSSDVIDRRAVISVVDLVTGR
jgi:hypothetical protein